MFTRRTFIALVDVSVALGSDESFGTAAVVASSDHIGLTNGTTVAGVRRTGVVQVT